MIEIVNIGYAGNKLWILKKDGDVEYVDIGEVEYPYFWTDNRYSIGGDIVDVRKEKIRVLGLNELKEMELYRVSVKEPFLVKKYARGNIVVEADIKYIERRIGADKKVRWVIPERYMYIDIEVFGENIYIGGIEVENGKEKGYKFFSDIESFIKFLRKEKIAMVIAWNGDMYDFRVIAKNIKGGDVYWNMIMKIDAMRIYDTGVPRSLDFVAKEENVGKKIDIDFRNASIEELRRYNENDIRIMKHIIEKSGALDITYKISDATGIIPTSRSQLWKLEGYIMKHRNDFGIWLLDRQRVGKRKMVRGADIYIKEGGIYENVAVFDYNSLYPSAIMFENFQGNGKAVFEVLKKVVGKFVEEKNKFGRMYKETGIEEYKRLRHVYKILANGSYGLAMYPYWRYFSEELASFITAIGRRKLHELRNVLEKFGYEVIYSDSVAGDTEIHTDKGIEKISDMFKEISYMRNGKEVYIPKNKYGIAVDDNGNWVKDEIAEIIRHKVDTEMYRVWFNNCSYVDITGNHSLVHLNNVLERRLEGRLLKEFRIKDGIKTGVLIGKIIKPKEVNMNFSDEVYIFLGDFISDGAIDKNNWRNMKISFGDDYEELIEKVILPLQKNGYLTENFQISKTRKGDVAICGKRISDIVRMMYDNRRKIIPKFIFEETDKHIALFLRGLFEGDGTVMQRGNTIFVRYTTIDIELAKQVRYLLGLIGIASTLYKGNTENFYRAGDKVYSNHTKSYYVNIVDIERFRELVHFVSNRKNERLKKYKRRAGKYNDIFSAKIKKIEKYRYSGYVYDISMKHYHNFVGNYILLHNTDSSFVEMPYSTAKKMEKIINKYVSPYTVELDKYFKKIIFIKNEIKGVKKRYAGITKEGKKIIVGLEAKRKDWCRMTKKVQEKVLDMIFAGKDISEVRKYINEVKKMFEEKKVDIEDLVIVKTIDTEKEYKNNTPQLRAYRKMRKKAVDSVINFVEYWIGRNGNVIVRGEYEKDKIKEAIDWKYYFNSQIKNPVMRIINSADIIRQMKLKGV